MSARRRLCVALLALLIGVCAAEGYGRYLGLHTPVLYEKTEYGYRATPNQDLRRFGHHVHYDLNGLRSPAVHGVPDGRTLRLLFLGDSIVNGGVRTDQSATIPYLVRDAMLRVGRPVEVLNASAPGWALANAAGWLNRHGTLNADVLLLVLNTFDLFQEEAPASVVGTHPAFPERAPDLALLELLQRYFLPRLLRNVDPYDPGAEMQSASLAVTDKVLVDLRWILLRARHQGAADYVVLVEPAMPMTAEARELSALATQRLRRTLELLEVRLIELRDVMKQSDSKPLFRDGLHPTVHGNGVIAQEIATHLMRSHVARH